MKSARLLRSFKWLLSEFVNVYIRYVRDKDKQFKGLVKINNILVKINIIIIIIVLMLLLYIKYVNDKIILDRKYQVFLDLA